MLDKYRNKIITKSATIKVKSQSEGQISVSLLLPSLIFHLLKCILQLNARKNLMLTTLYFVTLWLLWNVFIPRVPSGSLPPLPYKDSAEKIQLKWKVLSCLTKKQTRSVVNARVKSTLHPCGLSRGPMYAPHGRPSCSSSQRWGTRNAASNFLAMWHQSSNKLATLWHSSRAFQACNFKEGLTSQKGTKGHLSNGQVVDTHCVQSAVLSTWG